MGRKKQEQMEFRYYELQPEEDMILRTGAEWRRQYGKGIRQNHFHNLIEIGVCLDGQGQMILGEEEVEYKAGMITVIPANYPHRTVSEGDSYSYWNYLFFDPQRFLREYYATEPLFVSGILEQMQKGAFVVGTKGSKEIRFLVHKLLQAGHSRQEGSELEKQLKKTYLSALCLEIAQNNREKKVRQRILGADNQISPALDYIEQNYTKTFKVADLSEVCHMSETHFRRIFIETVQMTPIEYVNLIRIQHACERMRTTRDSMDEIARSVGYTSTATFNRNFRAIAGTSPYQWKKAPQNYETKWMEFQTSVRKGW